MLKKIILVLMVFMLAGAAVFSQSATVNNETIANIDIDKEEEIPQLNTIGIHGNLAALGLAINYERSFNPHFSVLGEIAFDMVPTAFTVTGKARFYPFTGVFFLEMGAGYGLTYGYVGLVYAYASFIAEIFTFGLADIDTNIWLNGLVLTPALGWKIDIGKKGGFTLPISMGVNIYLGPRDISPVDFTFNLRIGMGISF